MCASICMKDIWAYLMGLYKLATRFCIVTDAAAKVRIRDRQSLDRQKISVEEMLKN